MRAKVEETKFKLIPIVDVVRTKLTEWLEELTPLRWWVQGAACEVNLWSEGGVHIHPWPPDLQSKVEPYLEVLKSRVMDF
jgi:hypothetical protein